MKQESEKQPLSPPLNNNTSQVMFPGMGSTTAGLSMLTPQQLLAASRTAALMAAGIPVSLHATLAASPSLYRQHQTLFGGWAPPTASSPPSPLHHSPGPVSPALSSKSTSRRGNNTVTTTTSATAANNNHNNNNNNNKNRRVKRNDRSRTQKREHDVIYARRRRTRVVVASCADYQVSDDSPRTLQLSRSRRKDAISRRNERYRAASDPRRGTSSAASSVLRRPARRAKFLAIRASRARSYLTSVMAAVPDMSHLTPEERSTIEEVIIRQKQEEEKENEIMR